MMTNKLTSNQSGATAIEFGLIGGLVSLALISALTSTGEGVSSSLNCSADTIAGNPCSGTAISSSAPLRTHGQGNNHAYVGHDLGNGWIVTRGNVDGNGNAIDLNGSGSVGEISKDLATEIGKSYTVTFDHTINAYQDVTIARSFDVSAGETKASYINSTGDAETNSSEKLSDSFTFVATDTTTSLSFTSTADNPLISSAGSMLSNIVVTKD